jgi:Uma2 family endonuclease
MGQPARSASVYEQFLAVPDHLVAEIIRGVLVTQARPAARHARASSRLGAKLGGFDGSAPEGPGGWIILDKPQLHLGPDILVPEMAGWRRERMPELPDVAAFELAPDWVCEVLSPSTQALDRADKLPIYRDAAVAHAWLIDPIAQTLEARKLEGGRWSLIATHRDDARVRVEPFADMELELAVLWAR